MVSDDNERLTVNIVETGCEVEVVMSVRMVEFDAGLSWIQRGLYRLARRRWPVPRVPQNGYRALRVGRNPPTRRWSYFSRRHNSAEEHLGLDSSVGRAEGSRVIARSKAKPP